MEDPQTLLIMVLKLHFRERPQILDDALRIIKEYSNKDSTQDEYEKTLYTLRQKMNDLPENILLYFLTMIPLPKRNEGFCKLASSEEKKIDQSNRMIERGDGALASEKEANARPCCIRTELLDYLNSKIPPLVPLKKADNIDEEVINSKECKEESRSNTDIKIKPQVVHPKKQTKRRNVNSQRDCKNLLDICAKYVVKNKKFLNQSYKHKKEKVWSMVNSNNYNKEHLCLLYDVLKDINKKAKLMRMIDCDEVPYEIIREEYGNSDVFLKESHLYETVNEDPFKMSNALQEAIKKFVYK